MTNVPTFMMNTRHHMILLYETMYGWRNMTMRILL